MSDLEDRLRAYLGALLPRDSVPPVLESALASDEPFRTAHDLVHGRVRVTTEVEVDVLTQDAGLPLDEAAAVVGVSEAEARSAQAAVEEAAADLGSRAPRAPIVIVDDTGEPLVLPEQTDRRRRWPWLVGALVVLVGVAALVLTYGEDPCDTTVREVPEAPVAVGQACVTHDVDDAGRPVAPRHTFALGEPVLFWFSYDPRTDEPFLLSLVVTRDGEELTPQPQFPPPDNCIGPCDQAHVTIPTDLVDAVGEYVVEVRWEGETLAGGDFAIVRATS